jgi:hypothetical protein
VARVLEPGGTGLVQLPHLFGLRSLYNFARRGFRRPIRFDDIRYWTLPEMRQALTRLIGPSSLSVDAFFGLGVQASDAPILPFRYRLVVRASAALRRLSLVLPWMRCFADSIYVTSRREPRPA